jgi:hypothetical protein
MHLSDGLRMALSASDFEPKSHGVFEGRFDTGLLGAESGGVGDGMGVGMGSAAVLSYPT